MKLRTTPEGLIAEDSERDRLDHLAATLPELAADDDEELRQELLTSACACHCRLAPGRGR